MRCSLCLELNPTSAPKCGCGAALVERSHVELTCARYLLAQLGRWEEQRRIPPETIAGLRAEYQSRAEAIRKELKPAPKPEPRTVPEVTILPPPRPVVKSTPRPPPAPPRPPFAWKNLYTEQNIRWVLNLGIFIFSVALAVFIQTQWGGMEPALKVAILFGATFAAMAAGHFLRRTMLKATGMALVVLGAIALPIDIAAMVRFGLVPMEHADKVGLSGSLAGMVAYLGLAALYGEVLFSRLAMLAIASAWAFALRTAGLSWPEVAPLLAPVALAADFAGSRTARGMAPWLMGGILALTGGLFFAGSLDVARHAWLLEVAMIAAVGSCGLWRRRTGNPLLAWPAAVLLFLSAAVALDHGRYTYRGSWLPLSLLGGAFALGWRWRSPAFITASLFTGLLALQSAIPDPARVSIVLLIPAAIHAAYGLSRDDDRHAFAGWLLAGLALATALEGAGTDRFWRPLFYALYGVALVLLAGRRHREPLHVLGVSAAGIAMLLLAYAWLAYFDFKFGRQFLGAAIACASAASFGPVANRLRSRFVSDITYGCLGFAYILVLKGWGIPSSWLGLSVALFGAAYALLESRVSRWLLRPTLFTGIACTLAAGVFAALQVFVWREYLQASLTLLLIGGFYFAVAHFTPFKPLAHIGAYVGAAGWLVGMEWLKVPLEARPLLMFLPAGWGLLVASRRREFHPAVAAVVVALSALSFLYLDPSTYRKENLVYAFAASFAAAALAGRFAFAKPRFEGLEVRFLSLLMGGFFATGYLLWLKSMSTGGRPWDGMAVFAGSVALGVAAFALLRRGFVSQAWPLIVVSLPVTLLALGVAHEYGWAQGVPLWIYGAALVGYTLLGFSWAGALIGGAGLIACFNFWSGVDWIGVWTFPLALLALQNREKALRALGIFAAIACPWMTAVSLRELHAAGFILLAMSAAFLFTRVGWVAAFPTILATIVCWEYPGWNTAVLLSAFVLYWVVALVRRNPVCIYAALLLALVADYTIVLDNPAHAGLLAYPLALVLLAMAWDAFRRFGREFGGPLLGASFAAALLATAFALPHPDDRVVALLADALLFGVSAVLFRLPGLMYGCSAALVGLDLALMAKFGLRSTAMAFQLLTLALMKVVGVRALGDRWKSYLEPVFIAALVLAAGVLAFGISRYEEFTSPAEINFAIWGLMLVALIAGVAGRVKRIPAFLYMAAANLLGAYYLALHKYDITTLEFYTVPIGMGIVLWGALAGCEPRLRRLVEGLAVGVLFTPSSIQSYLPDGEGHAMAALVLSFGVVLAGMGLKRRVLVVGGTGVFILEVLGKALQYLIEQDLSMASWGMILGGLMIKVAALFELRKARFVRSRLDDLKAGGVKLLTTLD